MEKKTKSVYKTGQIGAVVRQPGVSCSSVGLGNVAGSTKGILTDDVVTHSIDWFIFLSSFLIILLVEIYNKSIIFLFQYH